MPHLPCGLCSARPVACLPPAFAPQAHGGRRQARRTRARPRKGMQMRRSQASPLLRRCTEGTPVQEGRRHYAHRGMRLHPLYKAIIPHLSFLQNRLRALSARAHGAPHKAQGPG
ncbi:MAG: hypothetical protein DBY17_05075 [Oscillospiraceae bacterium]|nr:MAG: hypothetical protein DBY17_05075 [Oscillospiraceae bacterium]